MKNSSKKASITGKGNPVEVKDFQASNFDAEKFLRENPMLAVELLILMVAMDLTLRKFLERVYAVSPEMETTHPEELLSLFLFLRGKSARSISSEKEERGDEARVEKVDSAPVSRQAGNLPKAKVGKIESCEDFVGWLGGKRSARKNLPIRIKEAGSVAKLAGGLEVNANTMTYWIKKIRDGVFAKPLRKDNGPKKGGAVDSGKELEAEDSKSGSNEKGNVVGFKSGSTAERVMGVLRDRETATKLMLEYGSPKDLASYLNKPKKEGEVVENQVSSNNLSFILKAKLGLVFKDVLKANNRIGSGSSKPSSAIALEVEQLSGFDQNIKDALIVLAQEREVNSLKNLFDSIDGGGNNLSRAARVFAERGIIKRGFPPDYVQFKKSLIKS